MYDVSSELRCGQEQFQVASKNHRWAETRTMLIATPPLILSNSMQVRMNYAKIPWECDSYDCVRVFRNEEINLH